MTAVDRKPFLDIKGVSKTFQSGTEALTPIDLIIEKGSFVALVGPSGCGKSTLLRMIAGLMGSTSGEIHRTPTEETQVSDIGFVFQDPTLMPWATVAENVALPLKITGVDSAVFQRRVEKVLSWVGLESFRHAYPRELSGGMRMRVSIARALVTEPTLLLLDEPFAALDEFTRAKLNDDLLALWQEHRWTGVFVTHSIREAVYLADRVIVMSPRPGRIVADVEIPFRYPRAPELRDDHAFSDVCADISHRLGETMSENLEDMNSEART